jgi:hypothetical protein
MFAADTRCHIAFADDFRLMPDIATSRAPPKIGHHAVQQQRRCFTARLRDSRRRRYATRSFCRDIC